MSKIIWSEFSFSYFVIHKTAQACFPCFGKLVCSFLDFISFHHTLIYICCILKCFWSASLPLGSLYLFCLLFFPLSFSSAPLFCLWIILPPLNSLAACIDAFKEFSAQISMLSYFPISLINSISVPLIMMHICHLYSDSCTQEGAAQFLLYVIVLTTPW